MSSHVLSVLVKNHSGVLSKISGLFSRRCFNIDSLTVGVTDDSDVSRMTIVARGDEMTIEQIKNQLAKLIDVLKVEALAPTTSVQRELALVKAKASLEHRLHVIEIASIFRARVIDVAAESLTMEVTGTPAKVDGLIEMLKPFGIIEIVRTGLVAMERGSASFKA